MSTPFPFDAEAFRAFEHAGWQDVAVDYDKAFAELTSQAIEPLLDAVGVGRGRRLLDVATGPGYAAGAAAQRGAEVVGIDFSAVAVAQARQNHPGMDFREGDAETLSFAEDSFDAVVMNFGLLHLGRPEQALAEIYRVLSSGGRVGLTVWAATPETVGFDIILKAIQTHGNLDVPIPAGPPFFRFSDHQEFRRTLLEAGFITPTITPVPLFWRLPSTDALFTTMYNTAVRTKALLRAQSSEALLTIRQAVREACQGYEKAGVVELPMPAVLATALKP
jgi:SAM-dependent methyltransferase